MRSGDSSFRHRFLPISRGRLRSPARCVTHSVNGLGSLSELWRLSGARGDIVSGMNSSPKTSGLRKIAPFLVVLVVVCSGVVPMLGILGAIAIPNFVAMQYRAKRAEIPANIDGIRSAEIAYMEAFGVFVAQDEWVPSVQAGKLQQAWVTGTGFDDLGWAPDGLVRGGYRVEITDDGQDFIVHGRCDIDGDGVEAHYTATRTAAAAAVTDNHVY